MTASRAPGHSCSLSRAGPHRCAPPRCGPAPHAAQTLAALARVTRYSRTLGRARLRAPRQLSEPVAAALVFGAAPATVFTIWMLQPERRHLPEDLGPAMWLAGSWILLSPVLIVVWESAFERLMCVLDRAGRDQRWDLEQIARWLRTVDRVQEPLAVLFAVAVAVGFTANNGFFREHTGSGPVGSLDWWSGLVVVTVLGYSFGVGIWGVAKTLGLARVGLGEQLRWYPFRPGPGPTLAAFGAFSYLTSALFSVGAVFLPGVYLIARDLNLTGQLIAAVITAGLLAGSFLTLLYPTYRMYRVSQAQKEEALTAFSAALEQACREAVRGSGDMAALAARVEVLLALRNAVRDEKNSPPAQVLAARLGTLLILPTTVGLLQSVALVGR